MKVLLTLQYIPYNIFHSSNFRYELYNLKYKFQGVKNLKYYDTVEKFQYATDSRAIYFFNCFSSNIHTEFYNWKIPYISRKM